MSNVWKPIVGYEGLYMERNHICKKCGGIAGWDSYFQSWICTRCGDEERKPITNYERIIRKTPEELADWVWGVETAGRAYGPRGKKAWLDWLKEGVTANDS